MAQDDRKDFYRIDGHHKAADSIAYSVGLEVPQIDDTSPGIIEYYFQSCNVTAAVENYDAKGNAEIRLWAGEGEMMIALACQQIHLMSQRAVAGLVRDLTESYPQVKDWRQIINNVAWRTIQAARSTQEVLEVGAKPETMRQDFRLFPVIHEGEPTTIYCPGGVGKSYLAILCGCLVQFDYAGFTNDDSGKMWTPKQGNVLYLDWEATHRDHLRRTWAVKRGLGIEGDDTFLYLSCEQPLSMIVGDIQSLIARRDIKLAIIDSQMAASDFGPDIGQCTTRFFNAVRQLRCSVLVLDHVSKEAIKAATDSDNNTGPHGSVVKANRSRQLYELKKWQVEGQSYTDLVLSHRKNNEGPLSEPFGIRLSFVPHPETGYLDKVTFTSFVVADHPALSKTLATWKRLFTILEEFGPLTVREIQEEHLTDKTEGGIRATLNQHKNKFQKGEGDQWDIIGRTA